MRDMRQSNVLTRTTALSSIYLQNLCVLDVAEIQMIGKYNRSIYYLCLFFSSLSLCGRPILRSGIWSLLPGAISCSFRCVLPVVLMHEDHMHGTAELM
jgi:hypothetical protein